MNEVISSFPEVSRQKHFTLNVFFLFYYRTRFMFEIQLCRIKFFTLFSLKIQILESEQFLGALSMQGLWIYNSHIYLSFSVWWCMQWINCEHVKFTFSLLVSMLVHFFEGWHWLILSRQNHWFCFSLCCLGWDWQSIERGQVLMLDRSDFEFSVLHICEFCSLDWHLDSSRQEKMLQTVKDCKILMKTMVLLEE